MLSNRKSAAKIFDKHIQNIDISLKRNTSKIGEKNLVTKEIIYYLIITLSSELQQFYK